VGRDAGKTKFIMPRGQRFGGGLGAPAVFMVIGMGEGGYFGHDSVHTPVPPIVTGLLSVVVAVMFFGRTTVVTAEGIAYGYFFVARGLIPWTRIKDITVAEKRNPKGGLPSWHIELHLDGGSGVRLPVPYAAGRKPSAAFRAEYDLIHQLWHQQKAHAKSMARRRHG
jgi:hypothetical protein